MPRAVDGMKQCTKCKETKPVSEYHKDKYRSDGLHHRCKHCVKQHYAENKEEILETKKQYYIKNKEDILKQKKQHYVENKEDILRQKKQYRQEVLKTKPYVYIATDRSTGCFYIGRTTWIIKERFRNHKKLSTTGLGKHMNEHNLSLNDFEIEQHQCSSVEESKALEKKLIAESIDNPLCLNKQIG